MLTKNTFTPLQEKWLAALDGGEIDQVTMNLVVRDATTGKCQGMCCLGVATYVANPEHDALRLNGWDKAAWSEDHDIDYEEVDQYGEDECTAPPDVVDALNLVDSTGKFRLGYKRDTYTSLIDLNDKEKMSFAQIAAFIREKPWFVFTNFDAPVSS